MCVAVAAVDFYCSCLLNAVRDACATLLFRAQTPDMCNDDHDSMPSNTIHNTIAAQHNITAHVDHAQALSCDLGNTYIIKLLGHVVHYDNTLDSFYLQL